jgi:glycosidase
MHNTLSDPPVHSITKLYPWLDHAQSLGVNALYLGPVFQSSSHGYDTVDYYQIDRRLGDQQAFAAFADAVHRHGMRLVLDGVFNHVGREFWAFKDVLEKGQNSAYVDWFHNLRFGETSPQGDPFNYEGWHGHYSLVKLNLSHPHVRAHLFDAVGMWIDQFGIDGLRLDAADSVDLDFLRALRSFTKGRRADFWLMGEVVHGDYRLWANPETLDSVTNYEVYKGLHSSLNAGNYFEIAHSLDRQSGNQGLYQNLWLYNFVDNHDVDRITSKLERPEHLSLLYLLLFSMPGIPSVYYGSEWGLPGVKRAGSDAPLRPFIDLNQAGNQAPHPDLADLIRKLGWIRHNSTALRQGTFQKLVVEHLQFAFLRQTSDDLIVVALNSAPHQATFQLTLPYQVSAFRDLLNADSSFELQGRHLAIEIPPNWGSILRCEG